ncbi:hypothetical protein PENTCL1PPCAC_11142, partial [Pristionchus entomophagus]
TLESALRNRPLWNPLCYRTSYRTPIYRIQVRDGSDHDGYCSSLLLRSYCVVFIISDDIRNADVSSHPDHIRHATHIPRLDLLQVRFRTGRYSILIRVFIHSTDKEEIQVARRGEKVSPDSRPIPSSIDSLPLTLEGEGVRGGGEIHYRLTVSLRFIARASFFCTDDLPIDNRHSIDTLIYPVVDQFAIDRAPITVLRPFRYRMKRARNNEAAKKSRKSRKEKEVTLQEQVARLNSQLSQKDQIIAAKDHDIAHLKAMLASCHPAINNENFNPSFGDSKAFQGVFGSLNMNSQ